MLLADGAMGTELIPRLGKLGGAPEAELLARSGTREAPCRLNLLARDLVLALHREYVAAGARLLVTNTLGASPEEAEAGVQIAQEAVAAAGEGILVAGCLAAHPLPTPALIEALAGADVLILETVTSLTSLEAAVAAIRKVSERLLWGTLSFDAAGWLGGLEPAEVVRRIEPLGLDAFGYGCGFGPEAARLVLTELRRAAPNARLIAKPNLGLPRDGAYAVGPKELAAWAADMAALGVNVIGACCGSTPAHIRAVAGRLEPQV